MQTNAPFKESPRRVVGRPFQPGTIANPGGRPKKTDDVRNAERMAAEASPKMIRKLIAMAENTAGKYSEAGELRATELVLAYGLGKPGVRDGELPGDMTFVVQNLVVSEAPVAGVLRSPIAAHVSPHLLRTDVVEVAS